MFFHLFIFKLTPSWTQTFFFHKLLQCQFVAAHEAHNKNICDKKFDVVPIKLAWQILFIGACVMQLPDTLKFNHWPLTYVILISPTFYLSQCGSLQERTNRLDIANSLKQLPVTCFHNQKYWVPVIGLTPDWLATWPSVRSFWVHNILTKT